MTQPLPQSVLFCCDHNAVRSPMAEGLMKKFYGTGTYVQSVGVKNDMEIDGFSIAVCSELDVQLDRHSTYKIVGEDEADIRDGLISFTSPIARAMIGKNEGDEVSFLAPGGNKLYEVIEVRYE